MESDLGIDVESIGRQLIKAQGNDTGMEVSDEYARETFFQAVGKLEQIRHVSSPINKVVTLSRIMDELMGLLSAAGEVNDADILFKMVFFVIVKLEGDDAAHLGARFIEDCAYIDYFMHDSQIGMI